MCVSLTHLSRVAFTERVEPNVDSGWHSCWLASLVTCLPRTGAGNFYFPNQGRLEIFRTHHAGFVEHTQILEDRTTVLAARQASTAAGICKHRSIGKYQSSYLTGSSRNFCPLLSPSRLRFQSDCERVSGCVRWTSCVCICIRTHAPHLREYSSEQEISSFLPALYSDWVQPIARIESPVAAVPAEEVVASARGAI